MGLPNTQIPRDKLPECWSDDVRMNALFAPFRIKTANPESWDMKMKFWSEMVRQYCRHRTDPVISAADIKFAFQRKGRTPACIDIVIEEMYRNGELSPISKYLQILHNGPEGWAMWGARIAFKPAVLAVSTVLSLLPSRPQLDSDGLPKASIESTQRFILESAVKEQATQFLDNFPPGEQRLGTIDELMKITQWAGNRETLEILLGYLVSQGAAVKKGDVVKLAEPNKKAAAVTETDEALVKLTSAETRLEADMERLTKELNSADADARAALKLGNRLAAKNHLRRKHKISTRAQRCDAALENVRHLLHQMREVDSNAAIVDTYRTSSQAMKRTMKEGGLEEDSVFDTMDELKDVLETYNEVEKALGTTVDDIDTAELEQELKELLDTPAPPGGGTPAARNDKESNLSTPGQRRKESERDFVFDGEERMLAELDKLSLEDTTPKKTDKKPIAVSEAADNGISIPKSTKPSKAWYPPPGDCLKPDTAWSESGVDASLKRLSEGFGELRMDQRLHPGQPLDVDFTTPPRHYVTDFQVRDHKRAPAGVWLYNHEDTSAELAPSTEYISTESPGKTGSSFLMAPGEGRRKQETWHTDEEKTIEDLETRLNRLRGFNM
ncbi:PREDICTED: charged multivesicular body protein 7 isoform X1 [Papilio xuthus]|uniref:Charged multivesicular body protein 7 isoform X1 n=1 Tax=Papilio xuthus TaxID=66420 RepID=A0AAJ7EEU3_PAPXU|nr:PREDICTED: charged multivesicular body protein 7 isoform X1 [Papilio xuthus]